MKDGPEKSEKNRGKKPKSHIKVCIPCQKLNLPCAEEKPCPECVHKGIVNMCIVKKKKIAKYLIEDIQEEYLRNASAEKGSRKSENVDVQQQRKSPIDPAMQPLNPSQMTRFDDIFSVLNREVGVAEVSEYSSTFLGYKESIESNELLVFFHQLNTGFDLLLKHVLRTKIEPMYVAEIGKSVEHFRSSSISVLKNLSESDKEFMNEWFYSAIDDIDKSMKISGTPMAVWRVSGALELVGNTFYGLTGWGKSELLGKEKLIFEIMDTKSMVDYWSLFSTVLFKSSDYSGYFKANLARKSGDYISCTFSFSVKRNIVGIPMLVIGYFLPVPTEE